MTVIKEMGGHPAHLDLDDAYVRFSSWFLRDLYAHPEHYEYITLARAAKGHGSTGHGQYEYPDCRVPPGDVCFLNAIVRVSVDEEREVIYRIHQYVEQTSEWRASWPD